MYELEVSVDNLNDANEDLFKKHFFKFVEDIERVNHLDVEVQSQNEENTRGVTLFTSSIILKAIELGIFAALYTAVIDFYDRYKNAEVTINFKNGNSMTLKGLTQQEALELIEKYSKNTE